MSRRINAFKSAMTSTRTFSFGDAGTQLLLQIDRLGQMQQGDEDGTFSDSVIGSIVESRLDP